MPVTGKQTSKRSAKRDLGAELLQSVRKIENPLAKAILEGRFTRKG
jgi:hypothetical protein